MNKILLVEDDDILRNAYKTKLTIEGFEVHEARDGREGLDQAYDINPDLIMLDLLMPNMDGVEFMKQYQPKNHPNTKIIVFSNFSTSEKIEQSMQLGATKYLVKANISPKDMVQIINEILEGTK